MSQNNKKNPMEQSPIIYPHGKPVTRRDMLKAGVINFSAAITLPSVIQWLAKSGLAEAQEACGGSAGSTMPVFVSLSLAGGAAMASNFVPHTVQGDLLPSYGLLGNGLGATLPIDRTIFANNAPFATASGMRTGITTGATLATRRKTVFVGIPNQSQDDSNMNRKDITGAVTRAGFVGNSLPNLGTQGSPTGGRHLAAYVPPPAPLVVGSFTDLANAIRVGGSLDQLSTAQKAGMFRMINRLTTSQAQTLAGLSGGEQMAALMQCATSTNHTLVGSGSTGTNPLDNPTFSNVWNINAGTNPADRNFVFASMLYNALRGNAGTCNLTLGGYDYHGNARNNTNAQDQAAGLVIGRILESAAAYASSTGTRVKLFLVVQSDGAVGSPMSETAGNAFSSDRGNGGCDYVLAFDSQAAPSASGFQIGGFTAQGQSADTSFITGDVPELAAAAAFYNYMSFAGQLSRAESILPRVFSVDQMSQIVKIA